MATAFALGARTDQKPPRTVTEQEHLQPIGNLLIDVADAADAYVLASGKRNRIVVRLDDPSIEATAAQRAEAEARAGALWGESQRHLKEFRRLALGLVRLWGDLPEELRTFVIDEAFPMPCWDLVADVAGSDQTCMGMAIWRSLVSGRDARKERVA